MDALCVGRRSRFDDDVGGTGEALAFLAYFHFGEKLNFTLECDVDRPMLGYIVRDWLQLLQGKGAELGFGQRCSTV